MPVKKGGEDLVGVAFEQVTIYTEQILQCYNARATKKKLMAS